MESCSYHVDFTIFFGSARIKQVLLFLFFHFHDIDGLTKLTENVDFQLSPKTP